MKFFDIDVTEMSCTEIRKLFLSKDESHLWPISGKFNATKRAIGRLRNFEKHNGPVSGLEYAQMLDSEISDIVNDVDNW